LKNNNGAFIKKIIFSVIIMLIFIYAFRFYTASAPDKTAAPYAAQNSGQPEAPELQKKAAEIKPSDILPVSTAEVASSARNGSQAAFAVKAGEKKDQPEQPGAGREAKPVETSAKKGVITGNGVNVRSESRVDANNSNVVVKVNKGDKVDIIGAEKPANDNRQWYNVKLKNGKTGFVREDLIKIE